MSCLTLQESLICMPIYTRIQIQLEPVFLHLISVKTPLCPDQTAETLLFSWAYSNTSETASLALYIPSSVQSQPVTARVVLISASPHKRLFQKL